MEFTFGICTYNSMNYVLETLESIKYQIKNYNSEENIECYLVIVDDKSEDDTVEVIKKWVDINNNLFKNIMLIKQEVNVGLANNYVTLLKNIHTEHFIKIDGDDVLSKENVFKKCIGVKKDECRIYFPMLFGDDRKVYIRETDSMNMFYYSMLNLNHKQGLMEIETYKSFMTPQVIIARSNISEECLEFISQYRQFEDDTSIWVAYKNNLNITLHFEREPLVLYRVHRNSLSNGEESIHQIHFLDDLHKFKKCMLKNEKNILIKLFLITAVWDTFLMKHRFSAINCLHRKLIDIHTDKISRKVKHRQDYLMWIQEMNCKCESEMEYLKELKISSENYISKK